MTPLMVSVCVSPTLQECVVMFVKMDTTTWVQTQTMAALHVDVILLASDMFYP